jgi:uncharacterized repeat protein (TIGR03803 family)
MKTISSALMSTVFAILVFVNPCILATAQTYTDLYNFDLTHGESPTNPAILVQGLDGSLYGTTAFGGRADCQGSYCGVAFRITPSGSYNVLHYFDGPDGGNPFSGFSLGGDGRLYGTTSTGGANDFGTIFSTAPGGGLTVHTFAGGQDGARPYAPPIEGSDGYFYGTAAGDYGATFSGAYKLTRSGKLIFLSELPGYSQAPLVEATDGNFYGTTWFGHHQAHSTVFRMTPGGVVTVIHKFDGFDGSDPCGPLIQGRDGALYGTASLDGPHSNGLVFRIKLDGTYTILHAFPDPRVPKDGITPCAGLLQATDGSLYGVTTEGGTSAYDGVIFRISPDGTYSIVHNFTQPEGRYPSSAPIQHTNGKIYGLTEHGGPVNSFGVVYSLDVGLGPFVKLVSTAGRVGQTGGILGQGLTGTTGVSMNGVSAAFRVVSDTFVTATIPSGATTGYVTVTTPSGILTSSQKLHVLP